ncbi:MAG: glycosyltransferase [Gammaproteobacteria bacterium]|nr:glycosyltransferase [Gammaproteobacteria bacterium]
MGKLSCIITCYNNAEYIASAIESVIKQSRIPDEIIIADDCSTDNSMNIIEGYAKNNPIIRVLSQKENVGITRNRDNAIRQASGDFITTLDGDDIYYPHKLSFEYNQLIRDPESVVFSNINWIDTSGNVTHQLQTQNIHMMKKSDLVRYLLFREGAIPRDMMYSKELFIRAGGFLPHMEIYEDWDLKLRLSNLASIWKYSGYNGIGYRRHSGGLSNANPLKHYKYMMMASLNNSEWISDILGQDAIPKSILSMTANLIGAKEIRVIT